ncbi:hypothetical protein GQ42DRAFT_66255 [Ramicandelaber brevisporus]|nr:hypothetical protein GQ42DRAFT_66255 [Ramicandelaber brevisporus]
MDKDGITIDQMRARRSSKSSSTAAASTASIESSPIPLRFVVNARRRCVSIVRTRGEPGLRNCIEDVIDDYLTQHVHNPESFCELTEHVTFGERLLQYPDRQTLESDAESQDTVLLDGNDDDDELSGDNDEEEEEEDGTLKGTPPAKQYKRDRVGQTLD